MDDTISRQAAINAVHKAGITEYDETLAIEEIEKVLSAQRTDDRMKTYIITSAISGDVIQRVVRMTEAQASAMQWIIDFMDMEDVTVEEISEYEAEVIE